MLAVDAMTHAGQGAHPLHVHSTEVSRMQDVRAEPAQGPPHPQVRTGVLAGLLPALGAMRLSVVDALRRV